MALVTANNENFYELIEKEGTVGILGTVVRILQASGTGIETDCRGVS